MTSAATLTASRPDPALVGADLGDEIRTFVTFDLAGQTFAASVADIREILDRQEISPLPNASADLLGMIDLRGEGIAVLDLGPSLGLSHRGDDRQSRIIVLDLALAGASAVAIMADHVRKVVEVRENAIDAVPSVPGGWTSGAMSGVLRIDGRLVYVIDLRQALGQAAQDLPGPFDFE
jgi:purine-binding chemotaxis protein CheW